jgi:hypothetical protein
MDREMVILSKSLLFKNEKTMNSPPASLEPQRAQRKHFYFLNWETPVKQRLPGFTGQAAIQEMNVSVQLTTSVQHAGAAISATQTLTFHEKSFC